MKWLNETYFVCHVTAIIDEFLLLPSARIAGGTWGLQTVYLSNSPAYFPMQPLSEPTQRRRKVGKSGGLRFMIYYMFRHRKLVVEAQTEEVKRQRI